MGFIFTIVGHIFWNVLCRFGWPLKRATKNKIRLALHLLLCSLWEKTRQKEKARDRRRCASLNAEKFEDSEEQVVSRGVPHRPSLSVAYVVTVRANYWRVHTRQYHTGVCALTWKSCIFKVSGSEFQLMIDWDQTAEFFCLQLQGSVGLFPGNAGMFLYRDFNFWNKILKSKDKDMFLHECWMLFLGKS